MPQRSLHIAWLGSGPLARESGGVPGVASDLLYGLAALGHRVDCLLAGSAHELPERLRDQPNLTFVWGGTSWRWRAWYNRLPGATFLTGLLARGLSALRLRRVLARRHRADPYDVVYQFNSIETLSLARAMRRSVPLVIQPEAHMRGELRFLIRERRLALRSQPAGVFLVAVTVTFARALVQRVLIRRAQLVICISGVFRDHLVRDYGIARERTVVIPNPVRLSRFEGIDLARPLQQPPAVLVLGRIAVRKGIPEVIELARLLKARGVSARIRVIGRASLWSNYVSLLEELPDNAEFAGELAPDLVPAELARTDVLLQASWYEPFGLTVAEALAAGVLVVATSEVGAIEGVDPQLAAGPRPGDVEALYRDLVAMLARLADSAPALRRAAHEEAARLFAPELISGRVAAELQSVCETFARR